MTGDVNPLTSGATRDIRTEPPTILGGSFRPIFEAFERLGCDGERLLGSAGLTRGQLADPDGRVSCAACDALVSAALREHPLENPGLALAALTPVGAYPLMDYLVLSSDTVGEGMTRLARYYRLVGSGATLTIGEEDDQLTVRADYADRFWTEYGLSLPLIHIRRESEGRARPVWVSFVHRPANTRAFEDAFGCAVRTGERWNGFAMTRDTWRLPMRRRDPALLGLLEAHADEVLSRLPEPGDIVSRVRRAIDAGLARGEFAMDAVARVLVLAPRTLQRRLARAGTTFHGLLEEARREAAGRHLAASDLSIAEISFALGYSEPAAFHRAFRRWHGVTPQVFRASRRA